MLAQTNNVPSGSLLGHVVLHWPLLGVGVVVAMLLAFLLWDLRTRPREWRLLNSPRIQALLPAVLIASFILGIAQGWWTDYWLLQDGQWGTAVIAGGAWGGHDHVDYRYTAGAREYAGSDFRSYPRGLQYKTVAGDHCAVLFSTSHPWLSALNRPRGNFVGLPVVLLAGLLETFFLAAVLNPKSRWAARLPAAKESD